MSLGNLRGRVAWVFDEDDFDIDLIIGVSNIKITDVNQLAALAMADRAPGFAASVQHQGHDVLLEQVELTRLLAVFPPVRVTRSVVEPVQDEGFRAVPERQFFRVDEVRPVAGFGDR